MNYQKGVSYWQFNKNYWLVKMVGDQKYSSHELYFVVHANCMDILNKLHCTKSIKKGPRKRAT
jgi:hypothetical protein